MDEIKEKLCEHAETLDEHEDRIKYLELADTETKMELKHLIRQVEKLVETIEKAMDKGSKFIGAFVVFLLSIISYLLIKGGWF